MFCTQCGAQLPDDSRFCSQCGAKIIPESAAQIRQDSGDLEFPLIVEDAFQSLGDDDGRDDQQYFPGLTFHVLPSG